MMDGKAVRQKLIGSDDERAVSPVIGVILMVAITVILAAVIAAFVLDMGSNQSSPAQAGLSIEDSDTDSSLEVTVTSMGDNTNKVRCATDPGTGSNGGSAVNVGTTFDCGSGQNVIATNNQDEDTVIQSNIGN